jgi:hypothetical protein
MWPDLCHVENVPFVALSFFGGHDLDIYVPFWIFASFDGFKEILNKVVGIFTGYLGRGFAVKGLEPEVAFDVHLDVSKRAILVPHVLAMVLDRARIYSTSRVNLYV